MLKPVGLDKLAGGLGRSSVGLARPPDSQSNPVRASSSPSAQPRQVQPTILDWARQVEEDCGIGHPVHRSPGGLAAFLEDRVDPSTGEYLFTEVVVG